MIDIPTLAKEVTTLLVPLMPYLVKAGEKAAETAAQKIGKEGWGKAKALWQRLWQGREEKGAVREAVQEVIAHPADEDAAAALRLQIKKVLTEDASLAGEIAALMQELRPVNLQHFQARLAGTGAIVQGEGAKGAGERGVVADTIQDSTINTGDQIRNVQAETYIEHQHVHDAPNQDAAPLRTAYLNHLFEQTGALSLAGVDPKAADESAARLNLDAVYTALLTYTPERQEGQEAILPSGRPEREVRHLSALDQLNRHSRLVLLGDPGSGKSTFVNFVALCLAGETLKSPRANLALLAAPLPKEDDNKEEQDRESPQIWEHGPLLPVRVVLRDFAARGLPAAGERATADHLWCFMKTELQTASLADYAPHLHQELLTKGGLILLDGLDEVPEAHRRRTQIREGVEDFAAVFSRCRMLVTGRTYAYQQQDWRLTNFEVTVLAPFSAGQIRRFVDRWYAHVAELRHLDGRDSQGRAEDLKRAIFDGDRLRGLAERPLLLTLMASLHAWRGGSLPEKREELYADAVNLLIDRWESQRVVRDAQGQVAVIQPSLAEWLQVDRDRVRGFLNELAYAGHAAQPDLAGTADVAEKELVAGLMGLSRNQDIRPQRLVEYLSQRAGLLVSRGVGVYTFPHRTFQEYLAACHLTDHDFPDTLRRVGPAGTRPLAGGGPAGRGQDDAGHGGGHLAAG